MLGFVMDGHIVILLAVRQQLRIVLASLAFDFLCACVTLIVFFIYVPMSLLEFR